MRYRDAVKLHKDDEVTLKATGETAQVLDAWTEIEWPGLVFIELVSHEKGWQQITHKEIV